MTESTALSIDDIGYGNPTLENLQIMGRTNYLDSLFNELSQILPPPNSSEVTQKESNDLVVYTAELVKDADTKERYLQYDYSLIDYIKKALKKHKGKRKLAAQELGISERTLYRKIKEYDINL